MRIALDAMGGDHAPGPIVAGAVEAVRDLPDLSVVLVGDRAQIEAELGNAPDAPRDRLPIVHASEVVGMHEKPVEALRKKRDNSISKCWGLMAGGDVKAVVSAGNTGAMVASALFNAKMFLPGVRRPGIAAIFPSHQGPIVLIDVGANMNPKAEDLYQYAVMGAIYAETILGVPSPTIGLLNVGAEEEKGNDLTRATRALLQKSELAERFVGNVEGRDIYEGHARVVVCEGFVGNVLLKAGEGAVEFLFSTLKQELASLLPTLPAAAGPAIIGGLKDLKTRFEYQEFGGGPLLGIRGACIICHGSSGARAIKNALRIAGTMAEDRLNELIVEHLQPPQGIEPAMPKIAFLFPGQGAQTVGMGRALDQELPAARALFDKAAAILGFDLRAACLDGPAEVLEATDVSQPGIFVASLAALEDLKAKQPEVVAACAGAAGLSLGEYTALVFAGALDFETGLRIVRRRGAAMQAAAVATPSGMTSVLGLDEPAVDELCRQVAPHGRLWKANLLGPGNIVVSGERGALEHLEPIATALGAGRVIPLAVAGAFHSDLMKPADAALAEVLAAAPLQSPRVPVYSNVDATPHSAPDDLRRTLVAQVISGVRWEDSMRRMLADGFDTFYEIGPGRVLTGLLKRIDRKVPCTSIPAR